MGILKEKLFVCQPQDLRVPNYVYKLDKELRGLKQEPRS